MLVQELSFDPRDPVIESDGWQFSFQVVTFENLYGISQPSIERADGITVVTAAGLTRAGGQHRAGGYVRLALARTDDGVATYIEAGAPAVIRCTKLIVRGLPEGELLGNRWTRSRLPEGGTTVHYPATTHTPLIFLAQANGTYIYFESLDDHVRAKRFTVVRRDDGIAVELIHEDAATAMGRETAVPSWRIGRTRNPAAIAARHGADAAKAFGLQPWERRADVPGWAREISLVAAIHGMHWTGYTFNSYDGMRDVVDYIADRIDGRRVLAFLPGWEGRYYWQYGDYRPEPLLGGADAFARLAQRARERGVYLMPMFGANCANRALAGFDEWGAPAEMRSPSGLVWQGNRPDWDTSRAHDPGWQAWLNPGAPSWRERLIEQVSGLVRTYDLPAVFFDTTHVWVNDPQHDVYAGLVAIRDELKSRFPNLLVTGEGWYDALGAVTPVSHSPSHLPQGWPTMFSRYNRGFLHLATGDPSRGSTGVHEQGYVPYDETPPREAYLWPTITFVDGTLEHARAGVDAAIARAATRVSSQLRRKGRRDSFGSSRRR